MKQNIISLSALLFFSVLTLATKALTQEQECQSAKNKAVGVYVACKHLALIPPASSSNIKTAKQCKERFKQQWRKIDSRAKGACLDAPLKWRDLEGFLSKRTNGIANLLGIKAKSPRISQRMCRSSKNIEVSEYTQCRFNAEALLARTSKARQYSAEILRCEKRFQKGWERIIHNTKLRGVRCLDREFSLANYKSIIDSYVAQVASVLAGRGDLPSSSLALAGSPLTLIAGGEVGNITVTNPSTTSTLANIKSNFAGTVLEGKVVETGNSCASLAPGGSCILTFNPGNVSVPLTKFAIEADGALTILAAIKINAAAPTVIPTATQIAARTETPAPTSTATTTPTTTPTVTPTLIPTVTPTSTPTATPTPAPAGLSLSGSPLQLTANGATGVITISNLSTTVSALNVTSNFTGTALDGNVTETGNTCANISPQASCTLTFTPGSTAVASTSFDIQGSNTLTVSASIEIQTSTLTAINASSGTASGGTGVTLSGTLLTGTTSVTFGGVSATSVNVINSTTVTLVTPPHAAGAVDVEITTSAGVATLTNGYTYLATAVGQSSAGGTIACLNGGLNNLIAATADNSTSIQWGALGSTIGAGAQSSSDGASNTASIVSALGNNGGTPYASQLCDNYEVDSQGNTPCESGNTCYNDWLLPAGNNATASGQLNCLYTNRSAIGGFSNSNYWSSTEFSANNSWSQNFSNGAGASSLKSFNYRVRCVRAFTP